MSGIVSHLWLFLDKVYIVRGYNIVNHTKEGSTHGHHQMVNNEIRLIIFFAGKDGEAL